ncbi:hypothetical protein NPX13_g140 [Xylaria arbuscula]|uniref:Zn(2)-C6 fungal-type domain-containing protein n=1 Tax=Xylaria arbuscula TaxID=114810 RepID=A0A9W8TS86_9PEZI|nr:hypothetical protein NPX13_g140 [Xylaria arbuscula]
MGPAPGSNPPNAGRTQIACQNCAQAKTGCDKGVPCTRCREKGLNCTVRYARRSTKSAYRAAQTSRRPSVSIPAQHPLPPSPSMMTINIGTPFAPASMDINQGVPHGDPQVKPLIPSPNPQMTIDPRMSQHDHVLYGSPLQARPDFSLSPLMMPSVDDVNFSNYDNNLMYQGLGPHEGWGVDDYPIYTDDPPFMQPDSLTLPNLSPMTSSMSEPIESTVGSTHTRSTSIISSRDVDQLLLGSNWPANRPAIETGALIASESGWPIARCNPVIFSGNCPKTAIIYLESLENKSRHEDTWNALEGALDNTAESGGADFTSVVPLQPGSRDRILAITQGFLQNALNIHRRGLQFHDGQCHSYLVLPPNKILEYFLRSYVRNLSCLYSLVPSGHVDPNEMIARGQASILLALLMISQGASVVSSEEARTLSAGLIETCRISLFDIIEKNVDLCADTTIHRCSLLFTLLGAWSGDKWLMDIAMGQRGMYISMLKHAGMFESAADPSSSDLTNIEASWRSWLDRETKNRLVYNWVMVDQELSLFHDTAPMIAVTDLCTPLPGPEDLWMSGDASQWMTAMQSNINCPPANASAQLFSPPSLTPSLFALFRDFLHNSPENQKWGALTPHRLRLLLHPLQSLLWNLRELKCYLSTMQKPTTGASKSAEKTSPMDNQANTQNLLQRWYELSRQYFQANPTCVVSKTNLVLFHLISLNPITNFPAIERLARREGIPSTETLWDFPAQHGPYIHNIEETVYHCGQVVSLVRAIPTDLRPIWWSAAIYRALLILWAYSILRRDASFLQDPETGIPLVIDKAAVGDEDLYNYMWGNGPKAVPVLSGPNNTTMSLDDQSKVADYAVKMLEEGVSTRFSDGIKRKLIALGKAWNGAQPLMMSQMLVL